MFMSPEQARGENADLDGRTDIFSLGIILYIMLVRRHPHDVHDKSRWDTIREIAEGRARPPCQIHRGFDAELEGLIMKALAYEREDRYQSAAEFAATLREFIKARSVKKPE